MSITREINDHIKVHKIGIVPAGLALTAADGWEWKFASEHNHIGIGLYL